MIGSALDLDSLSGDDESANNHINRDLDDDESRISTGAGSQVGLLKMSYTAAWWSKCLRNTSFPPRLDNKVLKKYKLSTSRHKRTRLRHRVTQLFHKRFLEKKFFRWQRPCSNHRIWDWQVIGLHFISKLWLKMTRASTKVKEVQWNFYWHFFQMETLWDVK